MVPTIAEKLTGKGWLRETYEIGMKSFEDMLGALLALRRLCECYQFLLEEDRLPLYPVIA